MEKSITVGEFGRPSPFNLQWGIKEPTTTSSFLIHPYFVQEVKKDKFFGYDDESPLEHLERFVENCHGAANDEVGDEYVLMKLFRLSLDGRAKDWLRNLTPNSLTTWGEVSKAFLTRFYSREKTMEMRRAIANFEQGLNETLADAWYRFRGLIKGCPHHGFETGMKIHFFYFGLDQASRFILDCGVGGSLRNIVLDKVEDIIEEVIGNVSWGSTRKERSKDRLVDSAPIQELITRPKSEYSSPGLKHYDFSCTICGGDNHNDEYCREINPIHPPMYSTEPLIHQHNNSSIEVSIASSIEPTHQNEPKFDNILNEVNTKDLKEFKYGHLEVKASREMMKCTHIPESKSKAKIQSPRVNSRRSSPTSNQRNNLRESFYEPYPNPKRRSSRVAQLVGYPTLRVRAPVGIG